MEHYSKYSELIADSFDNFIRASGNYIPSLLSRLAPPAVAELRRVLAYPPDCAGALMDSHIFYFHPDMTVNEALVKLRGQRQRGFRLAFIHRCRAPVGGDGRDPGPGAGGDHAQSALREVRPRHWKREPT